MNAADPEPSTAPPATPVRARRTEKVSESVAREILHDIVDRGLEPGTSLPAEAQMLETFRVGRASLREALRILEIHGLIQIKPGPGGGPVVVGAHSADLGQTATMYFHATGATFRELIEARLVLEPLMARQAAERQDPEYLPLLEQVVEASQLVSADDDHAYQRAATGFHDLVAGMSGNRVLDLLGRAMKDVYLDRVRELVFADEDRDWIMKEHLKIARAILKGDARRAEKLMADHMTAYTWTIEERFPGILDEVIDWR